MRIDAADVAVDIGQVRIVRSGCLVAEPGTMVGLIGPNGSGKSTMLRAVYRALRPAEGSITVDGDDVWALGARESALRSAVVLQDETTDFEFTVREAVELGRVPHHRLLDRDADADAAIVEQALRTAGVRDLQHRGLSTLSGGERQRVFVARALAQQTPVMVLDEPTNHLDISSQIEVLGLLRSLGITVVCALHDLNLAAAYCDRLFVMAAGEVVAHGDVGDVLTPALLAEVYGVAAHCATNPLTGRMALHFGPYRQPHTRATA